MGFDFLPKVYVVGFEGFKVKAWEQDSVVETSALELICMPFVASSNKENLCFGFKFSYIYIKTILFLISHHISIIYNLDFMLY